MILDLAIARSYRPDPARRQPGASLPCLVCRGVLFAVSARSGAEIGNLATCHG